MVLLTLYGCISSQNRVREKIHQDRFSHILPRTNTTGDLQLVDSFSMSDKTIRVKIINVSRDTIIVKNSWAIQEPSIMRLYAIDEQKDTTYYISHSYRNNDSNTIIEPGKSIESDYYIGDWGIDFNKKYQLLVKHRIAYFAIPGTDGTRFFNKSSDFWINKTNRNKKH